MKTISLFSLFVFIPMSYGGFCDFKILEKLSENLEITLELHSLDPQRVERLTEVLNKTILENISALQIEGQTFTKIVGNDLLIVQKANEESIDIKNRGDGKIIIVKIKPEEYLAKELIKKEKKKDTKKETPTPDKTPLAKNIPPIPPKTPTPPAPEVAGGIRAQLRKEAHEKLKEILEVMKERGIVSPTEKVYVNSTTIENFYNGMKRNIEKIMSHLGLTRVGIAEYMLNLEGNKNPSREEIESKYNQVRRIFRTNSHFTGEVTDAVFAAIKKYAETYQKPALLTEAELKQPTIEPQENDTPLTAEAIQEETDNQQAFITTTANILGINSTQLLEQYSKGTQQSLHTGKILEAIRQKMNINEEAFGALLGYYPTKVEAINMPDIRSRLASKAWMYRGRLSRAIKELEHIQNGLENAVDYSSMTYASIMEARNHKLNPLIDIMLQYPMPGTTSETITQLTKLKKETSREALLAKTEFFRLYIQSTNAKGSLVEKMVFAFTGDTKLSILLRDISLPNRVFVLGSEPGSVEFEKLVALYTELITSVRVQKLTNINDSELSSAVTELLQECKTYLSVDDSAKTQSLGELLENIIAERKLSQKPELDLSQISPERLKSILGDKTWPTISEIDILKEAITGNRNNTSKNAPTLNIAEQERKQSQEYLKEVLSVLKEKGLVSPETRFYVNTSTSDGFAAGMKRNIENAMDALNLTRKDLVTFMIKESGNENLPEIERQRLELRVHHIFRTKAKVTGETPELVLKALKKYAENYQAKPGKIDPVDPVDITKSFEDIEEAEKKSKISAEEQNKNRESYTTTIANILGLSHDEVLTQYGDGTLKGLHIGRTLEAVQKKMGVTPEVFGVLMGYTPERISERLRANRWVILGRLPRLTNELKKLENDAENFASYKNHTYDSIVQERNLALNPLLEIMSEYPIPGINPLEVSELRSDTSRQGLLRRVELLSVYIQHKEGEEKGNWLVNKMAFLLTGDKSATAVLFQHVTIPTTVFALKEEPGQVEFEKLVGFFNQLVASKKEKSPAILRNQEHKSAIIELTEMLALHIAEFRQQANRFSSPEDINPVAIARSGSLGHLFKLFKEEATLSNFAATKVDLADENRQKQILSDKVWPTMVEIEFYIQELNKPHWSRN